LIFVDAGVGICEPETEGPDRGNAAPSEEENELESETASLSTGAAEESAVAETASFATALLADALLADATGTGLEGSTDDRAADTSDAGSE